MMDQIDEGIAGKHVQLEIECLPVFMNHKWSCIPVSRRFQVKQERFYYTFRVVSLIAVLKATVVPGRKTMGLL